VVKLGITKENLTSLYQDTYIQQASHDNKSFEPIDHPLVKYASVYDKNNFLGAFLIVLFSKTEIEIHALLKKSSLYFSRQAGLEIIDFVFKEYNPLRITANIIGNLSKAQNYVEKLGFCLEGVRRDACVKDGKNTNINVYGLTQKEWREL